MPEQSKRATVNWRQAAGEALLIFLGVAVALLGQAWWEHRADRQLERHLLEGIRADLGRDVVDATRSVGAARARIAGADRLLRYLDDPDAGLVTASPFLAATQTRPILEAALADYDSIQFSPQEALHMVSGAISIQRLDISDASFGEATASGQLGVIRDLELRTRIADYYFTGDTYGSTVDPRTEAQWQRFRAGLAETGISALGSESGDRILSALREHDPLLAELKNVREYALEQVNFHSNLLARAEVLMQHLDEALYEQRGSSP